MNPDTRAVAVVGAGLMGSGIAQVLATSGCSVVLQDLREAQLEGSLRRIEDGRFGLRSAVSRNKIEAAEVGQILGRISTTTDLATACAAVDLVVEAVPEDLGLKMQVFRELDRLAPPTAVLTSNSGGLPIVALAEVTQRPQQVLGWHWAQPAPVMKLAELVVHASVSDEAIRVVSDLARACDKNPIVVRDQPMAWGYVANRIHAAARREAARVVEEGIASPDDVDALVRDCFRWPMGPFEMQDEAANQQRGKGSL
jgi:3-hydroxybutyryl-CoA dehydrogenase